MTTRAWSWISLAAAALLAAGPAGAVRPAGTGGEPEAEAKKAAEAPEPPSPQPIPPEQVFRAAAELDAPLRRAEAAAEVDPAVEEVEERLASAAAAGQRLRRDLEPQRLQEASAREIDGLRQALARADLVLADAQAVLEKRSGLLAGAIRELQQLLASWQLTAEAARRERAPPAVVRQIAQAESRLRLVEGRLTAQQDRLLELQGRVSDLRTELAQAEASVDQADAALHRQLFEIESVPLWRALAVPERAGALRGQLGQALRETRRDLAAFLAEQPGRIWIHLALVLVIGVGLLALRRPVAVMVAEDAALQGAAKVLARPWSAAFLISLTAGIWFSQPLPPTLRDLFSLVFLAPLLRLLPSLLPDLYRRPLYALAALFALDRLAAIAPPGTLLARLAMLLVTVGALAAFLRGLLRRRLGPVAAGGAWGPATRGATTAALGLLVVSMVSNVAGNATLAERLTGAVLTSAILAVFLLGVQSVLEGAISALLRLPILQHRALVARHRDQLQHRTVKILRIASMALWAWKTAGMFGIDAALVAAGGAVLGFRLQLGGLDVTLGNVAAFAVTAALALALSRLVRFVLDEGVFAELELPRGVPAAVSTTIQYLILMLGFSWAVLASGMEMSRFSFLVGALGVGIGFGLQNVVNNFVSGLILLYERPIQVGDVVEVGAVSGEVTRIGVRSSTVRTFPGAEVIVPNATLISTEVTNWTLSDKRRRIDLGVGVAYGTPPRQVIDLLLAAVRGRAGVLEAPAPVALFLRFGESSIDFTLRFWTADFDRWQQLASEVTIDVYEALGRAGIEIPFPQRDLHVRSLDPEAARALAAAPAVRDGRQAPPRP